MKVTVKYKSKEQVFSAESVSDLKSQLSKQYRLSKDRIMLTVNMTRLKDFDSLLDNSIVILKDLGPQISWKLVFLLEYLGPLLIHPLLYFQLKNTNSALVMILHVFHYAKRELETLLVHRFSHSTMPLGNLVKNCFHYWILGGICIAWPIYSKTFTPNWTLSPILQNACIIVWVWSQLSNLYTHVILKNLRPPGSSTRNIPFGFGFNLVSCPNYLFEIISWIMVSILSGSYTVVLFTIVGAIQMYIWAIKKHARYIKEFPKYPKSRTALIPYLDFPVSRMIDKRG